MTITQETVDRAYGAFYSQPTGTDGRDCMRAALEAYRAAQLTTSRKEMTTPSDSAIAQKFTERPVTIEAMQYDGTVASADAIRAWAIMPDGMTAECGRDYKAEICTYFGIRTLEGAMRANPGDWIIRGVKGEFYPCKPDIFEATYSVAQPAAADD